MNNGFIKIHRKILDWEWYSDTNTLRLFFHCIFKANWKDKKYKGTLVKRGEFLTSLNILAEETGLTVQQVRTCLKRLESTNEVTSERTPQGTRIQVVKYVDYQSVTNDSTSNQQSINKASTTTKERKEIKEDIEAREHEFKKRLFKHAKDNPNKYPEELYRDFFFYWSEHGENDKRMRFEKQDSFDLNRRLARWFNNDNTGKYTTKPEKVIIHKHEYFNDSKQK